MDINWKQSEITEPHIFFSCFAAKSQGYVYFGPGKHSVGGGEGERGGAMQPNFVDSPQM